MTDDFPAFASLVETSIQAFIGHRNVFVVDIDSDSLYATYLTAFPPGTNPVFLERTEHDCSTCKQVIRRAGNVIHIDDEGHTHTIWDKAASEAPYPYNNVAATLRDLVHRGPIKDLFLVAKNETIFGAVETHSLDENGNAVTWAHLRTGLIPVSKRSATADADRGQYRTTVQVFERGLRELKTEAIVTVLSLIDSNALYRGAEHRAAVIRFLAAKRAYITLSDQQKKVFVWTQARGPAARFRNTVIGTLVTDLSAGMPLTQAVGKFEAKVAPENYKRTTALITPMMVKRAMATIEELGLEAALERRFARIDDISINDVLWVDNAVKPLMKGGIGDVLMQHATTPTVSDQDEKNAEKVTMAYFLDLVLPTATDMAVLFKSEQIGNLMSLTAPVHPESKQLFAWGNDFAWSYGGNVADSIKERVKRAGGNVTNAKLRVSLSWFNYDDLDIHITEPCGSHIFYGTRQGNGGGLLDVDMNVPAQQSREAVENVSWTSLQDGQYEVKVHNYSHRESKDVGFVIETESGGKLSNFTYNHEVRPNQKIHVTTLHVKNGFIERFDTKDPNVSATGAISQERWGLHSENYVKVKAISHSPNYWGDNAVGNKHTFFVLEGAKNDEPTRGIYNEFLHPRLTEHRKVFEVIGDKTKCAVTEGQLSGLGFSSTKPDSIIIRVNQGGRMRLLNVQVGR